LALNEQDCRVLDSVEITPGGFCGSTGLCLRGKNFFMLGVFSSQVVLSVSRTTRDRALVHMVPPVLSRERWHSFGPDHQPCCPDQDWFQ